MERAVLQGLAVFRWVAWCWMAAVLAVSHESLDHPFLAGVLIAAAFAVTALFSFLWRAIPAALLRPPCVAAELAVGAALVLFDGVVYERGHAFTTSQSLGSVWPLVGVISFGVALGPLAGVLGGVILGGCRVGATVLNGEDLNRAGEILSLVNTTFLYAIGGGLGGYLYRLLDRADRRLAAAAAREEVARTLHDGVLQTLALVERRTDDPALARLARDQELELREFLYGRPVRNDGAPDLAAALRAAGARFEDRFGGRVQVLPAEDLPELSKGQVAALAGAVGEALANAGKHGAASVVTVYAEPDEAGGVFCSVKDDGRGFDVGATAEGAGIGSSIRGRLAEVGGRAEIVSRPGDGTEVRIWLTAP